MQTKFKLNTLQAVVIVPATLRLNGVCK